MTTRRAGGVRPLLMPKLPAVLTVLACIFIASPLRAISIINVKLQPQTVAAFNRYIQTTEARIDKEVTRPGELLYIEGLPEPQRSQVMSSLHNGEIYIERFDGDGSDSTVEVPGGLIHHWIGAVFIPGAEMAQVIAVVEDYDHHQQWYQPDVVRSRILHHDGNHFQIFYRLQKKKLITITLDTNHDIQYYPMDATHCHSRSVSTRIAEVVDANQPDEHEKPVGDDGGFLWRINSYWRFDQKDGGTYVEVESVSLTRDIPFGLGFMLRPFVTSVPRESLLNTLTSTRTAVQARAQHAVQTSSLSR